MDLWSTTVLGNTVKDYLVSAGLVIAAVVVGRVGRFVLERYFGRWAEKSRTRLDDLLVGRVLAPAVHLALLGGLWLAKSNLAVAEPFSGWIDRGLLVVALVLFFAIAIRFVQGLVELGGRAYVERLEAQAVDDLEERRRTVVRVEKQVREISTMVLWILGLLTVLSNLGVDLKAIWASLGIGGIALVVAVKEPLANLVGRLYIYGTGIFDEGHFIAFGPWSGTVTKIGLFRTYLELFSDMTTVSLPNADFVKGAVKNYFGRTKFMYKWDLDVPYDVDPERLQDLVERLRAHVLGLPEVNPQMCWIYLDRLDRYSKVIRVWFQAHLPDWAASLRYGNQVLHGIQRVFAEAGVEFAFPTQTVYLATEERRGADGTRGSAGVGGVGVDGGPGLGPTPAGS
ncbi:mechanosensitive ion channel family protein [Deferrisoma camini]|uniref:mechanosensitive ion channel family protein n=1 Tax=Deferrisoma camini TaxID=1035120 RepID=UPI00046D2E14|nr:mechanosensitive ion channel family protein [Deferrisoma camini]